MILTMYHFTISDQNMNFTSGVKIGYFNLIIIYIFYLQVFVQLNKL